LVSKFKNEYLGRINRAQDFIEKHLNEPLTLESIAEVANFSPFHFHRVFSAVAGESLYQFILRIRLERAAAQLKQNLDTPVTTVAFDCGFSSSATFARAFKAFYGMSASEWRDCSDTAKVRKDRKTHSKDRKASEPDTGYLDDVGQFTSPMRSQPMPVPAKQVIVEELPTIPVAYVRHVGPYAGDDSLFERLFGRLMAWAGPRGLLGPNTKTLTIYHDNPELTDSSKLRISCCVSVPGGTRADGEVGILELAAGKYARAQYEIHSTDYAAAWDWFMGVWMPSSGYQPNDGLCYELYLNDSKQHPEGKCLVELTMPVKPL
jgi:AraC family transcriptional regulator